MSTRIQVITTTIAALGLSLIVASGNLGSALALGDQERYDVGHHEGALQAAHDKVYGFSRHLVDHCFLSVCCSDCHVT